MQRQTLSITIFCLCIPLLILLFSYKAVVATHEFTPEQQEVMEYLQGKQELPTVYNEKEASHFHDVKVLIEQVNFVFYILLLIVTGLFIYNRKNTSLMRKILRYSGISTVSLLLIFTLSSYFFFDATFLLFHKILFPQGNFMFPINSVIKTIFPNALFFSLATKISLLALGIGTLFIGASFFSKNDSST